MKILLDTCVLIDLYAKREEFFKDAKELTKKLVDNNHEIYVAAYSIPTIAYVLRKSYDLNKIKNIIHSILDMSSIVALTKLEILNANASEVKDYEDSLMIASANSIRADYIVTRNIKDFEKSNIKCVTPEKMIELL